ncbi:MAG: hypothetical protein AAF358_00340 [Pseudomonadota bacterium]
MSSQPVDKATFQVVLNLMHELWVVKDRAAVLEQALAEAGVDVADKVDRLQPDAALAERLDEERKAFISRVLAPTLGAE